MYAFTYTLQALSLWLHQNNTQSWRVCASSAAVQLARRSRLMYLSSAFSWGTLAFVWWPRARLLALRASCWGSAQASSAISFSSCKMQHFLSSLITANFAPSGGAFWSFAMSLTSPHGNSIVLASQEAITSLTALSNSDDNLGPEEHPATEYRYSDEIDRLQIWMNEHSVRSGRLDYKLREASHLHDRVLSLLTELTCKTRNSMM